MLRAMRRPYTVASCRRVIERLATAIPRLGLGTDVIVGYPRETVDDFAATRELLETLPFSYLHVFPYSPRSGTEAARRPERVASAVVAERARQLRELGAAQGRRFRAAMVGRSEEALVLERVDPQSGALTALTGNFVEVTFAGPDRLRRRVARVRVTDPGEHVARGVLEEAA